MFFLEPISFALVFTQVAFVEELTAMPDGAHGQSVFMALASKGKSQSARLNIRTNYGGHFQLNHFVRKALYIIV